MVGLGTGRRGGVFLRVALVGLGVHFLPLAQLHDALGVAHPGGHAEQHRDVEGFADVIRLLHEIHALLAVRRLHHGQLGELGVIAVILLILGGMQVRVVGGYDDEPAVDAQIGGGEHGVRRHIDAHVLHGAYRPHAGDGRAVGRLQRHLFIGRPLAVQHLFILGQVLKYLRAGCAGVGRAEFYTGLVSPPGHRLIACHQSFHHSLPPSARRATMQPRAMEYNLLSAVSARDTSTMGALAPTTMPADLAPAK